MTRWHSHGVGHRQGKVEPVRRDAYPMTKKTAQDIARRIGLHYNRTRLHSGADTGLRGKFW